jgi:hypothetical protein
LSIKGVSLDFAALLQLHLAKHLWLLKLCCVKIVELGANCSTNFIAELLHGEIGRAELKKTNKT